MPNVTFGDLKRLGWNPNRSYTVATVPTPNPTTRDDAIGATIYVSNGFAGQPCLAFWNGTAWKQVNAPATTISAV